MSLPSSLSKYQNNNKNSHQKTTTADEEFKFVIPIYFIIFLLLLLLFSFLYEGNILLLDVNNFKIIIIFIEITPVLCTF